MAKKLTAYVGIVALLCSLFAGCGRKTTAGSINIYYMNALGDGIGAISYEMEQTKTEDMVDEALQRLATDPDDVDFRKTISGDVQVLEKQLDSGILSLYFNREYSDLSGYTEVLVRAAIVKTLVQIKGIDSVSFYVSGEPLQDSSGALVGSMSADTFIDDYGAETDSLEKTRLTLYFASADGQSLVKKNMDVYYNKNVARERLVMDYLLKGPNTDDAKSVIPSGTKILNVTVTDGVCYVSFDSTFLNANAGIASDVVLYSIVNSLTELDTVNKVQILVDGASTMPQTGIGFKLGTSYERDTSMAMKATEREVLVEGAD